MTFRDCQPTRFASFCRLAMLLARECNFPEAGQAYLSKYSDSVDGNEEDLDLTAVGQAIIGAVETLCEGQDLRQEEALKLSNKILKCYQDIHQQEALLLLFKDVYDHHDAQFRSGEFFCFLIIWHAEENYQQVQRSLSLSAIRFQQIL